MTVVMFILLYVYVEFITTVNDPIRFVLVEIVKYICFVRL